MIRQLSVTLKTAGATLTYAEIGDIVVNSASAVDITLPTPNGGLWYRVSNVNDGEVSIKYSGATITTLKNTEQALLLANSTSAWWMSKGSGAMTKEEIEAVLTGEISSHTHPAVHELPTGGTADQVLSKIDGTDYNVQWSDPPASAGGAGAVNAAFYHNDVTLESETDNFAIGITEFDADTDEIFIFEGGTFQNIPDEITVTDTTATRASGTWAAGTVFDIIVIKKSDTLSFTGLGDVPASYSGQGEKLVRVNSTEDGLEFIAIPNAPNGLPTGGSADQFLRKKSGTNYDTEWADMYRCRAWVTLNGSTNDSVSGTYVQSGTTVTVTLENHGYLAGHNIYADITSGTAVDGTYIITEVTEDTFTYTAGTSLVTSGNITLVRSLIRGSGNVHSVSKSAAGLYAVNFLTEMANANYAFFGAACEPSSTTNNSSVNASDPNDITTKYLGISVEDLDAGYINCPVVSVSIFY
jgi:hypothetical protein